MDNGHFGLDGRPIYPRAGHFDHVTGQPLPTFQSGERSANPALFVPLAILMVIAGVGLAYASDLFG